MPLLWRYLLGHYLKVLFLSTTAFIAVLLTTRLDEIAHFATLGSQGTLILWYTLYQIPYILPIALPISTLISTLLLTQRMSVSHELTALRASGLGLRAILSPLLVAGVLLSFLNFYIVSELATQAHLKSGLLKTELRSVNPLLLLHNKHLMRLKGMYFDTLGASKMGEYASDVLLASPGRGNKRMNLLVAGRLKTNLDRFYGRKMTLISSLNEDENHQNHLLIENIQHTDTLVNDFSQLLQKKVWSYSNDHLKMSFLKASIEDQIQRLEVETSEDGLKSLRRGIERSYAEIIRRLSLGMAVFTFTLMGAAFGMSIGRHAKAGKSVSIVIMLSALYLIAYFSAKGIEYRFLLASSLYLLPHLLIICLSIWTLRKISRGIE